MTFDSLLFDMDGTLWDAVDSYCAIWNSSIADCCPGAPAVDYATLATMMGKPLDEIFDRLIGSRAPRGLFMERLTANEEKLMPELGGKLYPGVRETIAALAEHHKLFMVSNCTRLGLPNFLSFTGLKPYFTDSISFGDNNLEKDRNIALMVERHGLKAPLYIGDTAGDCHSSHAAGVPFVWARYGFGKEVAGYDYAIDSITDLTSIVK